MQSCIDLFPGCSVAVLGDMMLDCYIEGRVDRVSPEAPVPVLQATAQRSVPGGAANVAANLAALDLHVRLIGIVGADETRDDLLDALDRYGVDVSGVVTAPGRQTTRKLRVIAAQQQIVRVDQEDLAPIGKDVEDKLIASACAAIDTADIVVVSDYGKGVCSDAVLRSVFDYARDCGKRVIVDPKRLDLSAYRGATILTPNRKELASATRMPCESDEDVVHAAAAAQAASGAMILLTRSEKGMSFFSLNDPPFHISAVALDVFDVSGAGDTVVAVLAASIAAGVAMVEAVRLANHAAGIVVSKRGTASVTRAELAIALRASALLPSSADGALLDRDAVVAQRWAWAREKLIVGVANGCFDLLHPGHVSLLRQAAGHCDRLIVALNTDASVKRLKGDSRPIQTENARAEVMGAIKGVAAVVLFDEDTPYDLFNALQPDVIVKGADYRDEQVVGADIVKARNGRVVLAQLTPGQSTSRLVSSCESVAPVPISSDRGPLR